MCNYFSNKDEYNQTMIYETRRNATKGHTKVLACVKEITRISVWYAYSNTWESPETVSTASNWSAVDEEPLLMPPGTSTFSDEATIEEGELES